MDAVVIPAGWAVTKELAVPFGQKVFASSEGRSMSTSSGHEVQPISRYVVAINAAEYGEEFFEFTYRMDGTGTCIDKSCGGDPLAFTWDQN